MKLKKIFGCFLVVLMAFSIFSISVFAKTITENKVEDVAITGYYCRSTTEYNSTTGTFKVNSSL